MGFYKKYILPRLLNSAMASAKIEKLRPEVIGCVRGTVLEIGAGSGLNLPFYKEITKLYALEPSRELRSMAQAKTKDLSFPVELLEAPAEHIPLPNASVDTVLSTWTLCSIGNPMAALQEIKRVLRREGRFVFIDHGISPKPMRAALQKFLTPITKVFTGNCHMDRDIRGMIEKAGFTLSDVNQFHEKPLIFNTQGIAKK